MIKAKKALGLFSDEITADFDAVRLSIASPEQIRSWSFGEVKRPETINYRTFKPEKEGLFCSRIFGPVKDYECLCGKYKRIKFKGIVCEKCGVEVTQSKVRRERMGHIELASPVAHIWFAKSLPSRIGALLDLSTKELDKILYYESYIVTDPGLTSLKYKQILSEEEYVDIQNAHNEGEYQIFTGALALKKLLTQIDLEKSRVELLEELDTLSSEIRRKKVVKRLKLVNAFIESKTRPEYMILDVIPVIPPELRPLVPLDGGRFATADLNDLYRRLINRNNRLKRLCELKAPEIIIRNEERMLQEIADALFDNSRRGRPVIGSNKRPLKSLSDTLKGKQGRFRQNLLGKRVDYSGRSVIVVGPYLKLNQCGLPKKMALELFRPFVYHRLEKYGLVPTLKAAKRFVEKERPEVWGILEEVVKEHPVLLNRAPTLHRLGIQAFEPLLVEGKAIQLHPLVCKAFNADFDGDTMSVHLPISIEAQLEARVLMMSTNNILSPADGSPVIVPSLDMVLGLYYLTAQKVSSSANLPLFASIEEVQMALFHKKVTLHDLIKVRLPEKKGERIIVETTPGRLILSRILPEAEELGFELVNKPLVSSDVAGLIEKVYHQCGSEKTVVFADRLMALGFEYATLSGVSFGKDDLVVPEAKQAHVDKTWKLVQEYRQQYLDGLITQGERYNKVTDAWENCTERVVESMMKGLSVSQDPLQMNGVYMMAHSGARGSVAQMRQLAAMRGLIVKHSGEILEHPIISNFAEGLKAFEYFNSTHGSRKGLSDTALKTANSGYLTRRLVDVAQDCMVTETDCGTTKGIMVRPVAEGGNVLVSLEERVYGRVLAEDIQTEKGDILLAAGMLVDREGVKKITSLGLDSVRIRSVLTCESVKGVCKQCYGLDIARNEIVSFGEAVGVVAAQSIGEPGTQLTLRTFHLGGAAQKSRKDSVVQVSANGMVEFEMDQIVENSQGQSIFVGRNLIVSLKDKKNNDLATYHLPHGAELFVQSGASVKKGDKVAEWNPYTLPLVTEKSGFVHFVDLVEGVSFKEIVDEETGVPKRIVLDWRQIARGTNLRPRLVIRDAKGEPVLLDNGFEARYFLSVDALIDVANGAEVKAGDVLAQMPKESSKVRDITGGLPRITELVEARRPKDPAMISEFAGRIEFGKDYKTKRAVLVVPDDETLAPMEYFVPRGRHILVQEGYRVKKGDLIVDGSPVLQDILRIMGVEALASYLIYEIQEVYRFQGVKISDKHIEVIVRQMLQKVEITHAGQSLYLVGDQLDRREFEETNKALIAQGREPAKAIEILQGITRASLQTSSFISAASFMETTRVLTEAAIWGKLDKLSGLKESVIVGRLIPAGTGWVARQLRENSEKLNALQAREKINDSEAVMAEHHDREMRDTVEAS